MMFSIEEAHIMLANDLEHDTMHFDHLDSPKDEKIHQKYSIWGNSIIIICFLQYIVSFSNKKL